MSHRYLEWKLGRWQQAGLIDAATRERILEWESAQAEGWAMRGLMLLGAAILGIGLISLVAANWARIPAVVKLSGDGLLLAGLGAGILATRRGGLWHETFILLFQFACLASIGLVAQLYHLSGPIWRALALWSLITGPLTLFSRTLAAWSVWSSAVLAALGLWLMDTLGSDALLEILGLLALTAWLLHHLAAWCGLRRAQQTFGAWLLVLGLILTGALDLSLGGTIRLTPPPLWQTAGILLVLPAMAAPWLRPDLTPPVRLLLSLLPGLVLAAFTVLTLLPLRGPEAGLPSTELRGALFSLVLLGTALAACGLQGWRRTFNLLLSVIGLRVYGLYLKALGGLAATGMGLVVSGLLLILLVQLLRRIQHRFAGGAS